MKLYLIPTELSEGTAPSVTAPIVAETLGMVKFFLVENIRTARRWLRKAGYTGNLDDPMFEVLDEHNQNDPMFVFQLTDKIKSEGPAGLLSEAGCPAVADPGSSLVLSCHQKGIQLVPLPGPSSIILGLMASGLLGQRFSFVGYLPKESGPRREAIKKFEKQSGSNQETIIFIETPYRNQALFKDVLQSCHKDTLVCVASGISSQEEYIKTLPVELWKRSNWLPEKVPAVFLIFKR